jgi:hypothetical protein
LSAVALNNQKSLDSKTLEFHRLVHSRQTCVSGILNDIAGGDMQVGVTNSPPERRDDEVLSFGERSHSLRRDLGQDGVRRVSCVFEHLFSIGEIFFITFSASLSTGFPENGRIEITR